MTEQRRDQLHTTPDGGATPNSSSGHPLLRRIADVGASTLWAVWNACPPVAGAHEIARLRQEENPAQAPRPDMPDQTTR